MFYPWVPSGDNPADMPSRRYETKSKPQVTEELPASEPPLSLLHVGQQLDDVFYFIHFCFGPRRPGDVLVCIERSSAEIEMGHVSHADLCHRVGLIGWCISFIVVEFWVAWVLPLVQPSLFML